MGSYYGWIVNREGVNDRGIKEENFYFLFTFTLFAALSDLKTTAWGVVKEWVEVAQEVNERNCFGNL